MQIKLCSSRRDLPHSTKLQLLGWFVVVVLTVFSAQVCSGCGGGSNERDSSADASSGVPTLHVGLGSLPQDEDDDDDPGEEVGAGSNPNDSDIDGDRDNLKERGFYDHDDTRFRAYGHAASPAEKRELTTLAKRYYAAAAAEDGSAACAMLVRAFAKSLPEDYGHGSAGPPYLRTATSCQAVLELLFKYLHSQLHQGIEVVAVRVDGDHAHVLLGGLNMPASYLEVQREGGAWRIIGMLAAPLP